MFPPSLLHSLQKKKVQKGFLKLQKGAGSEPGGWALGFVLKHTESRDPAWTDGADSTGRVSMMKHCMEIWGGESITETSLV